jgi:hypothetical protein
MILLGRSRFRGLLGDAIMTNSATTLRSDATVLHPLITPIAATISRDAVVVAAESMPVVGGGEASSPSFEPQSGAMIPIGEVPFYRKGAFWGWAGLVAAVAAGAWAWGRAG